MLDDWAWQTLLATSQDAIILESQGFRMLWMTWRATSQGAILLESRVFKVCRMT